MVDLGIIKASTSTVCDSDSDVYLYVARKNRRSKHKNSFRRTDSHIRQDVHKLIRPRRLATLVERCASRDVSTISATHDPGFKRHEGFCISFQLRRAVYRIECIDS